MYIAHNSMAANTASNLNAHYANLATSTQRLSTGLRVNSAKDDAAGLAIRELQRAEISALQQGVRNANDAISLLQVADGALAIIDEKLIRMKGLAEQASTGTYDSTQRLMIDSEFQAMAAEIDRIANATDFNGIKLLDGSKQGEHNGSGLNSTGALKIHFGTGNDSAEDYYYININDASTRGLGLTDDIGIAPEDRLDLSSIPNWWKYADVDYENRTVSFELNSNSGEENHDYGYLHGSVIHRNIMSFHYFQIPSGLKNISITQSDNIDNRGIASTFFGNFYSYEFPHLNLFTASGKHLVGIQDKAYRTEPNDDFPFGVGGFGNQNWFQFSNMNSPEDFVKKMNGVIFDASSVYEDLVIADAGDSLEVENTIINLMTDIPPKIIQPYIDYEIQIPDANSDMILILTGPDGYYNYPDENYHIKITAKFELKGNDYELIHIDTQDKAQTALSRIDKAIVNKDKIRANLGTMQNRLENTVTNLTIQSQNLQAAESRISDTDIATEMTNFVRNQILTQSAVAMLSQANSLPQMVIQLIK